MWVQRYDLMSKKPIFFEFFRSSFNNLLLVIITFSILHHLRCPKVPLHIHMPISFKTDTFFFQQYALSRPPWSSSTLLIHHPMARQILCPWRISQRPPHHSRMTGPTGQSRDMPIGRYLPTRYLTDDVQHIPAKRPRLLCRHPTRIVLIFHISAVKIGIFLRLSSKI